MLRRLLACLVALAIAMPSLGVAAAGLAVGMVGVSQAATCDCPPDAPDCPDRGAAGSCEAACLARCMASAPSLAASSVRVLAASAHTAWRAVRAIAPPDVAVGPPLRPPRSTIPD